MRLTLECHKIEAQNHQGDMLCRQSENCHFDLLDVQSI